MNAAAIEPSKTACMITNLDGSTALLWAPTFGLFEMEIEMHRTVLAAAASIAILAGASLAPQRAEAMPAAPTGLATAITANSLAQDVAYVCRRVWRCGPYGCGWRRACYWTGPRRYWEPRHYRRRWYRR
jgi:hypothetical protein